MVKLYKIESGEYTGMECVKASDYQDVAEDHVLLKADYEQLQQAHSKAVELAAQLAKQVGELTEERDALAAYCEELKAGVYVGEGWLEHNGHKDESFRLRVLLTKSPQTCLAEHDAKVVEEACEYIQDGVSKYQLKQYAQQLRDKANA